MSIEDTQKIENKEEEEEVLDQETKEIQEELGLDKEEEETPPKKEDVEAEDKSEDEAEVEDSENKKDEETEEESEDEEEDEDPEDVEPKKQEKRPVKAVPIAKYLSDKKKLKDKILDLEDKLSKKGDDSKSVPSKDLKELAEEYGVDEDFVTKLAENISSKNKLPEDVQKKLDILSKKSEQEEADKSFDAAVKLLQDENPNEPIMANKEKIKELGYTEGHTTESAYELYFRHVKTSPTKKKKTAEKTKPNGEISKEVTDFDDPNLDTENLSDSDFDKFSDAQAAKEKKYEIK